MFRIISAVMTIAVLVTAVVLTASVSAWWAMLAAATVAFHFAYLLFVMLGALLGLRDLRWLAAHLPVVVWGAVGLAMTRKCPVTLLEKQLWEKAGRTPYEGSFLQHYVFGLILPEGSHELVYWAQAGLVVGAYALAIHRHLTSRRAGRGPVRHRVLRAAEPATKRTCPAQPRHNGSPLWQQCGFAGPECGRYPACAGIAAGSPSVGQCRNQPVPPTGTAFAMRGACWSKKRRVVSSARLRTASLP